MHIFGNTEDELFANCDLKLKKKKKMKGKKYNKYMGVVIPS